MGFGDIILLFWIAFLAFFEFIHIRKANIHMNDKKRHFKWLIISSGFILILASILWHGPTIRFFGLAIAISFLLFNTWEMYRFCPNCESVNQITNCPWQTWTLLTRTEKHFPNCMSCKQCGRTIFYDDSSLRLVSTK